MNKHTPGPWELRHERHLGKTDHVVKIGTASVYFNRGIGQTEQNAISNARLIASAPELLEALESCIEYINIALNAEGDCLGIHHNGATDAVQAAEVAIAKARGL